MDFNIKAEKPVSGIVIAPDSKTYSFTNVTNGTVAAPRRASGDYLVVFSGATIETETRYSLGIGIEADGDFGTFIDTARYEPNNTEGAAVSLDTQKVMAYLYKNDIDYYRVSYSNVNFPSSPTDVSASVVDTQVTVSWTGVADANSYNVYRADSQTGTYTKVGVSASSPYTEKVTAMGIYYYEVSAVNVGGFESAYSVPTAVTVTAPGVPTNVSASSADAEITVSWNAVTGASSYNVYRADSQTGIYTKVGASASSPYTETVTAMGIYYYEVSAVSASNFESTYSAPTAVTVTMEIDVTNLPETFSWLSANAIRAGHYTLLLGKDESLPPQMLSYSGTDVTIALKGKGGERIVSLSGNGSLFTVESGVTLVLDDGVTLKGHSNNTTSFSLIWVYSGGNLVLKDGGEISGSVAANGGGVRVNNDGTFTMSGGKISSNSAEGGGGVLIDGGTFIMSGGAISGNTAAVGGGVAVNGGTFTMSGGTISNNTTSYYGGGVYVYSGTFTQSGGTISGNSATYNDGGGVYVSSSGTFTKQSDGIIYGSDTDAGLKNTATSGVGHAVYVSSGNKKRDTTAGVSVTLDSTKDGAAGGWQ
jgi:hypothetical protein